jgi:hypothetical protein
LSKPSQSLTEREDKDGISPLFNQSGEVIGTFQHGKITLNTTDYDSPSTTNGTDFPSPKKRLSRLDKPLSLTELLTRGKL